MYGKLFKNFFEILGCKEIWETFCTDFVNYFIEILRMRYFQKDFGQTKS